MDKIFENLNWIMPITVFLVGWLLPPLRFNELGKALGGKIPKSLGKLIADRLDAFEKGILDKDVKGDRNITSNKDFLKEIRKVKIDLGLKE